MHGKENSKSHFCSSPNDKRKYRQNSKNSRNSKGDIEDIFGELKMLGKLPLSNTRSIDQQEESLG